MPKPVLEVTAEDYEPGVWKNSPPMFTLSGIPEDSTEYVYGVFICDERLILLSNGNNMYVPSEEGLSSVRFVILDKMGDVQSLSDQYDTMLDFTPPDGPYLSGDKKQKVCYVEAYDDLSGLDSISYDGGKTWLSCNDPEKDNMTFYGEVGEKGGRGLDPDTRLCGQHLFKRRGFHLRQEEAHRHGKRHGNGQKAHPPREGNDGLFQGELQRARAERFRSAADGADHRRHGAEPVADRSSSSRLPPS